MKLLTWNILHSDYYVFHDQSAVKVDDVLKDQQEVKQEVKQEINHEERLIKIFDTIKLYDADIVCLQEVDSSQIDAYINAFPNYKVFWQSSKDRLKKLKKWREQNTPKPHTITCATLIKNNIETLNTVIGSRSLSNTIKYNNKIITISNVHLESGKNVNEIHIKHVSKLIHSDILCGDFNDFIGEPVIEYVKQNNYNSVYDKKCPPFTFDDKNKKMLIDFIFYKSPIKHTSIEWEPETKYSDHIPIITEFEI